MDLQAFDNVELNFGFVHCCPVPQDAPVFVEPVRSEAPAFSVTSSGESDYIFIEAAAEALRWITVTAIGFAKTVASAVSAFVRRMAFRTPIANRRILLKTNKLTI